jgi:hypothetical protein
MFVIHRPLSLGSLLNATFDIYRRNFLLFLGISAIPNAALLLVLILFDKTLGTILDGIGILGILGVFFTIVAIVLVPSIVAAATTFAVSDVYEERTTSIKSCCSRVSGKALNFSRVSGKALKILAVYVGAHCRSWVVPVPCPRCLLGGSVWRRYSRCGSGEHHRLAVAG